MFVLSQTDLSPQAGHKLPKEELHTLHLSRHYAHGRCPTAACLPQAGFQKGEEGLWAPSKRGANSPTPSTAQLPGYCPRPGHHLLWVISICMAIITAFGKKIPLSKSPAELLMPAQNWRRQVRWAPGCSQERRNSPSHPGPLHGPKEHGRPCWQPLAAGPPQPAPCLGEGHTL